MYETEKSRFYPDEFDWWELPNSCGKCAMPFHIKSGQDFPFCPNCIIDNRNAKRGREVLAALKARVILAHMREKDNQLRKVPDVAVGCRVVKTGYSLEKIGRFDGNESRRNDASQRGMAVENRG